MSVRGIWTAGVAAFLLLVLVTLWVAPGGIEDDLRTRGQVGLENAGYGWATVEVDGRDLTVWGAAPDVPQAEEAVTLLESLWGVGSVEDRTVLLDVPDTVYTSEVPPPAALTAETCHRLFQGLLEKDAIEFEPGTARLAEDALVLLYHVGTVAVHCPRAELRVVVAADDARSRADNEALGAARARAIRDLLVVRGVGSERITALGQAVTPPRAGARPWHVEISVQY